MSKKWFTADFHLFHHNIINYCDRPFQTTDEMHETIIAGMNSRVGPNDLLYILGDVSFYAHSGVCKILDRINGKKHLIIGNHDAKKLPEAYPWETVSHYKEIKDTGQNIVLMHYPIHSWNKMAHGAIHLHGHCHGTLKSSNLGSDYQWDTNMQKFAIDIGVDCWDFKPVCLDDICIQLLKQSRLV